MTMGSTERDSAAFASLGALRLRYTMVGTSSANMHTVVAIASNTVSRKAGHARGFSKASSSGARVNPSPGREKPKVAAAIQGAKKKTSAMINIAVTAVEIGRASCRER